MQKSVILFGLKVGKWKILGRLQDNRQSHNNCEETVKKETMASMHSKMSYPKDANGCLFPAGFRHYNFQ